MEPCICSKEYVAYSSPDSSPTTSSDQLTAIFHLLFVCQFNHLYYWCKDFEQSMSTQTQSLTSCLTNPVVMVTYLHGHPCGHTEFKTWAILIFINTAAINTCGSLTVDLLHQYISPKAACREALFSRCEFKFHPFLMHCFSLSYHLSPKDFL